LLVVVGGHIGYSVCRNCQLFLASADRETRLEQVELNSCTSNMTSKQTTNTGLPSAAAPFQLTSLHQPPTTLIPIETELKGPISFGRNNIIHPKTKILSEGGGPIIFGDGNILEEGVVVVNWGEGVVKIGDGNLLEVGACKYW
jgi:hypothetical protein